MCSLRLATGVVVIFVVSLVSIWVPVDDPQTAFDEADTPINIGAIALGRIHIVRPPVQSRSTVGVMPPERDPTPRIDKKTPQLRVRESRVPLDLLQELRC